MRNAHCHGLAHNHMQWIEAVSDSGCAVGQARGSAPWVVGATQAVE